MVVHIWPCLLLQTPAASQVPAQRLLGSVPFFTGTQAWVVASQLVHWALQSALAQQPVMGMQIVIPFVVQDFVAPLQA
ncbi:MAG: hypothetical protein ABJA82_08200 [Myxococcales bacterium]